MAYTLSDLIQRLMGDLGQSVAFKATGGSQSTAVNGALAALPLAKRPKENYATDYTLLVARDAGGANAAPEGEFQRVSLYGSANYTYTVDTNFSAAVAAGDRLLLITSEFPLQDMIQRISDALQELTIALVDTSLTTVQDQQDYALPVAAKREKPLRVEVQTVAGDSESYKVRDDWEYVPSAAGSTGILHFLTNNLTAGMTIRIMYKAWHPAVSVYNSVIHETMPKSLAVNACKVALLEWYVTANEDKEFWAQKYNIARNDLIVDMQQHARAWLPPASPRFMAPI